jgi:hypothetical protein
MLPRLAISHFGRILSTRLVLVNLRSFCELLTSTGPHTTNDDPTNHLRLA